MVLCRDVYHCPPSVLDEQDAGRVLVHLDMLQLEASYDKADEELPNAVSPIEKKQGMTLAEAAKYMKGE